MYLDLSLVSDFSLNL